METANPHILIREIDDREHQMSILSSHLNNDNFIDSNITIIGEDNIPFDDVLDQVKHVKNVKIMSVNDFAPKPYCGDVNDSVLYESCWKLPQAFDEKSAIEKYGNFKIKKTEDEYNRTMYMIHNNDPTDQLMIVVFSLRGTLMVSVNDNVMPLDELMAVSHMRAKLSLNDMHLLQTAESYPVLCETKEHKSFEIANTTIAHLMMALVLLDKDYSAAI